MCPQGVGWDEVLRNLGTLFGCLGFQEAISVQEAASSRPWSEYSPSGAIADVACSRRRGHAVVVAGVGVEIGAGGLPLIMSSHGK